MRTPVAVRSALAAAVAAGAALLLGAAARGLDGWLLAGTAVLAAFVTGLAAAALMRGYGALLRAVELTASRIAAGKLDARVVATTPATEKLASSFNSMAEEIETTVSAAAAERARLRAIVETTGEPIVAVDGHAAVQLINDAALELFAENAAAALGKPLIEVCRDHEISALVLQAIEETTPRSAVLSFGPAQRPLRAAAYPISEGGTWSVLLVITDLEEFQRIDRVRRDFVTNVSHELRTPLASIKAMTETVAGEPDMHSATAAGFLRRIASQVDHLSALVSDLLDLSRIESGALELTPQALDISALLADVAATLRNSAEQHGITIDLASEVDRLLSIDRTVLVRILTNLLDNAVKFSPPGAHVRVRAIVAGTILELTVADDGPGLPTADLARVFERFYKAGHSRDDPGTGLGLAIVKHLAKIHGGSVEAESREGKGTTFTVRLREQADTTP